MIILKDKLVRRYKKNNVWKVFIKEDLWKDLYSVLVEYLVILSIIFLLRNSLNLDVVYDYFIMDEVL